MKARSWILLALALGMGAAGCSREETPPPAPPATNTSAVGANPLTAPVDYLGVAARAQQSAARVAELATLKQAIQLFQASEGRFPKDLQELVTQGSLTKMPTPPKGMRFTYHPQSGEVRLVQAPPGGNP